MIRRRLSDFWSRADDWVSTTRSSEGPFTAEQLLAEFESLLNRGLSQRSAVRLPALESALLLRIDEFDQGRQLDVLETLGNFRARVAAGTGDDETAKENLAAAAAYLRPVLATRPAAVPEVVDAKLTADTVTPPSAWRAIRANVLVDLAAERGDQRLVDAAIVDLADSVRDRASADPARTVVGQRLRELVRSRLRHALRGEPLGSDMLLTLLEEVHGIDGVASHLLRRYGAVVIELEGVVEEGTDETIARRLTEFGRRLAEEFAHHETSNLFYEGIAAMDDARLVDLGFDNRLEQLGLWMARAQYSNDVEDLYVATQLNELLLDDLNKNHPHRAALTSVLGWLAYFRFMVDGRRSDLDRSIELGENARALAPRNDAQLMGTVYTRLASAYRARGETDDSPQDLQRSIDLARAALELSTISEDRVALETNLGTALKALGEVSGDVSTVDEAIAAYKSVRAGAPPDSVGSAELQLASALLLRFELNGELADLDECIKTADLAAVDGAAVPMGQIAASRLLGAALHLRWEAQGQDADHQRAIELLANVATSDDAPPVVRVDAARIWASLDRGDPSAWSAALRAAALIPTPRALPAEWHRNLAVTAGLAADAAALALDMGDLQRALDSFEQGRGLVFNRPLREARAVEQLRRKRPHMASEYQTAADRIRSLSSHGDGRRLAAGLDNPTLHRHLAASRLTRLISEIRAIPGFGNFLLGDEVMPFLDGVDEAWIVAVNVASTRSDALIVHDGDIDVVALPHAPQTQAEQRARQFWSALERGDEATVRSGLEWLWDAIAAPIIEHLAIPVPGSNRSWPRLVWCPSGPLTRLPLHAAGHHEAEDGATCLDRVVSSTVSTLTSLKQAGSSERINREMLVVAVPKASGFEPLPGVVAETDSLLSMFPHATVVGAGGPISATSDRVADALERHGFVHFACHAVSDSEEPWNSRLVLAGSPERDLTMWELANRRNPVAQLAYLSACSTAAPAPELPDEPLHLAAAMQLVGFRHVVGSLWPVADDIASWMSDTFYSLLLSNGEVDPERVAISLHHAVRRLRAEHQARPSRWAGFVHVGL